MLSSGIGGRRSAGFSSRFFDVDPHREAGCSAKLSSGSGLKSAIHHW
jgi:hypothetical protein